MKTLIFLALFVPSIANAGGHLYLDLKCGVHNRISPPVAVRFPTINYARDPLCYGGIDYIAENGIMLGIFHISSAIDVDGNQGLHMAYIGYRFTLF